MGYLLLSFSLALFLLGGFYDRHHGFSVEHAEIMVTSTQRAIDTVQYMNAINDYLYAHPDVRHSSGEVVLTPAQVGVTSSPALQAVLFNRRVFLWQLPTPGLMAALNTQTVSSALLGHITGRRLVDNSLRDMQVSVPARIPDGAIVYLN